MQSCISCLYLMAGGFFRKRHRSLLYTICRHFGLEQEPLEKCRPEPCIPVITVEDFINMDTTVTLTELGAVDGNISPLELLVIACVVRQSRPVLSLEIDTFDGRTALNIALNQQQGTEVVTIDLPPDGVNDTQLRIEESERKYILKKRSGERLGRKETPATITQLYGNSVDYDFSQYRGKTDLIFIDGSHSYDFVINDSRIAMSLVRPHGVIIWHDYDTPHWHGVTRALNELYQNHAEFKNLKQVKDTSLCILRK